MATDAYYDLSANIWVANPVFYFRRVIPQAARNTGPVGIIIGTVRCAANGTNIITGFDEVFHAKGVNLTDTDEVVLTTVSGGTVTFDTVTAGDLITFKIIGRAW